MSGTPGHVSLRSVCDRLFHRPMRATRRWNGTKSSRNRFLAAGFSNALTNDETAVSYSVFRLIQLVVCLASRISENCRAVRDAQGNLLYYEGTVEDISERKHAEEQIRRTTAEL